MKSATPGLLEMFRSRLTDLEVGGDFSHFPHEFSAEVFDVFQIVLHGVGQVHQVVQIDGVVISPPEFQVYGLWFALNIKHKRTQNDPKESLKHNDFFLLRL